MFQTMAPLLSQIRLEAAATTAINEDDIKNKKSDNGYRTYVIKFYSTNLYFQEFDINPHILNGLVATFFKKTHTTHERRRLFAAHADSKFKHNGQKVSELTIVLLRAAVEYYDQRWYDASIPLKNAAEAVRVVLKGK